MEKEKADFQKYLFWKKKDFEAIEKVEHEF